MAVSQNYTCYTLREATSLHVSAFVESNYEALYRVIKSFCAPDDNNTDVRYTETF